MKAISPQTAAARLKKVSRLRPTLAIVLGSGFHHVLSELRVDKKISYAKIPGFPKPTVSGHAGELYFGHLGKTPVMVLSGRAHFYEGHSMDRVTFAVRALAALWLRALHCVRKAPRAWATPSPAKPPRPITPAPSITIRRA